MRIDFINPTSQSTIENKKDIYALLSVLSSSSAEFNFDLQ